MQKTRKNGSISESLCRHRQTRDQLCKAVARIVNPDILDRECRAMGELNEMGRDGHLLTLGVSQPP